MQINEIIKIYEEEKNNYFKNLKSQNTPKAILLGGQPACGKGALVPIIENKYLHEDFLIVNGDNYRIHHPNFKTLKNNAEEFSAETQIFSNVFTERFIQDAIENKYNIIIEGTMRNPTIPYNTAKAFKERGFNVEVLCISAPALFTELGYHNRFQEEVNYQGWGRLAEKSSHDTAVIGLLDSLDMLYNKKIVDKIHLYSYLANAHIETYSIENNEWNIKTLPSHIVEDTREMQLKNKEQIENLINRGIATFNEIDTKHKSSVDEVLAELENVLDNLERRRGFRR